MKKKVLFIFLFISSVVLAQESPLWMRYSAISPDGKTIVFSYKGEIYKVNSGGGRAEQLTTNPAQDTRPIWAPDGTKIAFASDREGGFDIFEMSIDGGAPTRLTSNTANATPLIYLDNNSLLYSSNVMQDVKDGQFPSGQFPQIYKIDGVGQKPQLYSSYTMEEISLSPDKKKLLYQDKKGYEDTWRKHHTSSITRDIWMCNLDGERTYEKITSFAGEDRNPIWAKDGQSFYYLSEQDGTMNVYKRDLKTNKDTQLTSFKGNPVRFLTTSNDNLLSFGYDGELYTLKEGGQPQKVQIELLTDNQINDSKFINFSNGATEMAISKSGKEIAYIIRGDVFVSSVEYGTTKRITNTPTQERNVSFSPDGRYLLYSSERDGVWNIYQTSLSRKEDDSFVYAKELKEDQLTNSGVVSFQPLYSPDGKEVAFLEDRTTIKVINLATKKERTVLDGKCNYSYSDGDQWFQWSPDGLWILSKYIGVGGWHNGDMAIIKADGTGEIVNFTESGYTDTSGRFVLDGKAMLWFSDKAGYRSHGSWGADFDAYIMFFDQAAFEKFQMSKEDLALLEANEKKNKKTDTKKDEKSKTKDKKDEPIKPINFDFDNRKDRVIKLTPTSSSLSDALLNNKGDKLYFLSKFEKGYDLWVYDLKDKSSKILTKDAGSGELLTDSTQTNIILLAGNKIQKIDMNTGASTPINIKAEFEYQPKQEREYIFDHAWRQVKDKFYVKDLHGIDWDTYKATYQKFLPHINNNYDFAEMLSEMLGELNGSHTGARYGATGSSMPTAYLGAFYDDSYQGDGLKVLEVLKQGPLAISGAKIKTGSIITKIDNEKIEKGKDYYPLLAGKTSKNTLIAYKEAVVVDTRHNGGGWLHDDLVTLLSGKEYQRFEPRGQYIGSDPYNKWTKPSIVLVCEDNYSNAHGFPWLYKELKVGELVGTPVPGTMTAVWWERQIDPSIVFGIPQVAVKDMRGNYLENQELEPDVLILNDPASQLKGEDKQLEKAVNILLGKEK